MHMTGVAVTQLVREGTEQTVPAVIKRVVTL